jgi:hypothetical protein
LASAPSVGLQGHAQSRKREIEADVAWKAVDGLSADGGVVPTVAVLSKSKKMRIQEHPEP